MSRTRAFTLLEVALIVAIIGMMLLMIVGYLFAPKEKGPLPPVAAPKPVLSSTEPSTPGPRLSVAPTPIAPTPIAPTPIAPTPIAPAAAATPVPPPQTIELSPQSPPTFR